MDEATLERLADISKALRQVAILTADMLVEDYCADDGWIVRLAVERCIIIVGESLVWIRHHQPDIFAQIPDGAKAIALRNVLVHEYSYVEDRIIFQTATSSLPILSKDVRALLPEPGSLNRRDKKDVQP